MSSGILIHQNFYTEESKKGGDDADIKVPFGEMTKVLIWDLIFSNPKCDLPGP